MLYSWRSSVTDISFFSERKRSFWGWTTEEWIDSIEWRRMERQHIVAIAYRLCDFADIHRLKCDHVVYVCLARKVFGRDSMKTVSARVFALLLEWGCIWHGMSDRIMRTVFETLLYIRSLHFDQLALEHLRTVIARKPPRVGSYSIVAFSRVLASMGTAREALEIHRSVLDKKSSPTLTLGVPPEWARLCRLWFDRSTYARSSKTQSYYFLRNLGRWLGQIHPTVLSPADWTRVLAAELISVVCQWHGPESSSVDNSGKWIRSCPTPPQNQPRHGPPPNQPSSSTANVREPPSPYAPTTTV